jgi:hypothetical protein
MTIIAVIFLSLVAQCLASYDDKIRVQTVFGTGRATTTDTTGLDGEINNPFDNIFDPTENYLYLTDQNGGGIMRKLAVTNRFTTPYSARYFVKTVFVGMIRLPCVSFYLYFNSFPPSPPRIKLQLLSVSRDWEESPTLYIVS